MSKLTKAVMHRILQSIAATNTKPVDAMADSRSAAVFLKTVLKENTMSTTTSTSAVVNATIPTTVVKHDTSAVAAAAAAAKPSIKLGANAKVVVEKKPSVTTPMERLQTMESATRNWEANELAASNKRLYSILMDAYTYYMTMKTDTSKDVRAQYAEDLKQFIAERKYVFAPTSHDMTRVVKCVFGADRRRASAYSLALREALRQQVAAKDLAVFIEQNGGVEQIRLGGTKPLSAKVRAGKVKQEVLGAELGLIKFDARLVGADADWADKQVVIVATYLPSGEFQANAVIRHDSAVNAALAAYFSNQQAAVRAVDKAERDAEQQRLSALKKSATKAKSSVAKNAPQSVKAEKQTTKAAAEQAKAKADAANRAHAESLFETAQA
jgi:hypothetical protein